MAIFIILIVPGYLAVVALTNINANHAITVDNRRLCSQDTEYNHVINQGDMMHKFIDENTWAVLVLGIIQFIIGESQTYGQAANGTNKQLIFDIITLIGVILTISGIVLLVRKRKSGRQQ